MPAAGGGGVLPAAGGGVFPAAGGAGGALTGGLAVFPAGGGGGVFPAVGGVLGALVDVGGVLVAPVAGVLAADLLSVVLVAVLAPFASLPASFEA